MGSWMLDMVDHEQELMGIQCVLDHVTHDIMRISRYVDFLVDDVNYINDPSSTLNANDFDLSFDLYRVQKLFANFRDKYKKDLGL